MYGMGSMIQVYEIYICGLYIYVYIFDALRDFGSNSYKRRSNGLPKRHSN